MEDHLIIGIHVTKRVQHVPSIQEILTRYGCNIRTRLGLHEVDEKACSPSGVIVLEMFGDRATCQKMADELAEIDGVEIQQMRFVH